MGSWYRVQGIGYGVRGIHESRAATASTGFGERLLRHPLKNDTRHCVFVRELHASTSITKRIEFAIQIHNFNLVGETLTP
jgi:hypothetical protein